MEKVEEFFNDLFKEEDKQPVVRVLVDLKLNHANVTFFMVNNFLMKKLESYGVPFEMNKNDYTLNSEMKKDLEARMEAKKDQESTHFVLSEAQKQEFLKNLMKQKGDFVETDKDGNTIHFKVVTRVVETSNNDQKDM